MKTGKGGRAVQTPARNPVLESRGWRGEREKRLCAGPTAVQLLSMGSPAPAAGGLGSGDPGEGKVTRKDVTHSFS